MKKSVRVYYAGIPAKNTNKEKELVLDNFHAGVPAGQSVQERKMNWQPSDLAVLQGWVHANSGTTPHLMFRREIIEKQKSIGKHTLAIDSNLFLYKDPRNARQYLRFSLNDVFPTTGEYFWKSVDPDRWKQIKQDIGFDLKPWRTKGKHVLICLQRNGGWSMGELGVMDWLHPTIAKIKQNTDRPIIVRAHPGDKKVKNYLRLNEPNVKISNSPTLQDDLHNAWCSITYNSSPGVASAIEGIPVYVTDPDAKKSQAYEICNTDLNTIENPIMPDRQKWIEKIAMSHYNFNDLKTGKAWEIIKDYI